MRYNRWWGTWKYRTKNCNGCLFLGGPDDERVRKMLEEMRKWHPKVVKSKEIQGDEDWCFAAQTPKRLMDRPKGARRCEFARGSFVS